MPGKKKGRKKVLQAVTTETMIFERWEGNCPAGETVEHTIENTLGNAKLASALNWGWMDAVTVCDFRVTDPEGHLEVTLGRSWQPNLADFRSRPVLIGVWKFAVRNISNRAVDYNIWARFS